MKKRPLLLIVDDEPFNVDVLEQELEELDLDTISAANGQEALERVAEAEPDMILLDIMMPIMDGFSVLEKLKANKKWRDIPVLVISAMSDMDSIVRGIKLGAEDYLPKPFDEILLDARVSASLEKKRLRDQEVEYLRQVDHLTEAAVAVEQDGFEEEMLAGVAAREDALGNLGRVFLRMAQEIHARERRLRMQIEQLQADVEEKLAGEHETALAYMPIDRRVAMARGESLPDYAMGAVLIADVAGFTTLTEHLARSLGWQRGAEEMTRLVNQLFSSLIERVHDYGGSVVNFAGDAITCWFAQDSPAGAADPAWRAAACAVEMQKEMTAFEGAVHGYDSSEKLAIKTAVASGHVRRFLVGDPTIQLIEVIAGRLMDELAEVEHLADGGQTLITGTVLDALHETSILGKEPSQAGASVKHSLIGLHEMPAGAPWPDLDSQDMNAKKARPWVLASVYRWLGEQAGAYMSELRQAEALFLQFEGIEYESDEAQDQLDRFARWVQQVVGEDGGTLMQITVGDKGSYLYIAFGVPLAQPNSARQAVRVAFTLMSPPADLSFIRRIQIGIAGGLMRVGAYGGTRRRTFGMQGDRVNLAARLMQAAEGHVLCDESVFQAARRQIEFETLPSIVVKGKRDPVAVYRPKASDRRLKWQQMIDQLDPGAQLALKVASIVGQDFRLTHVQAIYPLQEQGGSIKEHLILLCERMFIFAGGPEDGEYFAFADSELQATAYDSMLFAQRRQLHRQMAQWLESEKTTKSARDLALLGYHWQRAEDPLMAIGYLEKAGEQARLEGDPDQALSYLSQALRLDADAGVLSENWSRDASE